MAVMEPNALGVIARKSPQSRLPLRALQEARPARWQDDPDGHLIACDLGGGFHVAASLAILTDAGLVQGQDFVITAPSHHPMPGVQGETPEWRNVYTHHRGTHLNSKLPWSLRFRRCGSVRGAASTRSF